MNKVILISIELRLLQKQSKLKQIDFHRTKDLEILLIDNKVSSHLLLMINYQV